MVHYLGKKETFISDLVIFFLRKFIFPRRFAYDSTFPTKNFRETLHALLQL